MTSVIRWNPYRSLSQFNRELENFFEDFGIRTGRRWPESEQAGETWIPAVDVSETKEAYLLKADLPGVAKEDVKVTLTAETLTIAGEKKSEKDIKDQSSHRCERSFGSFTRSFQLPGPVAADRVRAEYHDGVLTLTVPKAESSRPREIQIQ